MNPKGPAGPKLVSYQGLTLTRLDQKSEYLLNLFSATQWGNWVDFYFTVTAFFFECGEPMKNGCLLLVCPLKTKKWDF